MKINAMKPIISISKVSKTYKNGYQALTQVDLDIQAGEILALLGPNGAGKTTLISIICGLVSASTGSVSVAGHDIVKAYRKTRSMIGLVPQELTLPAFEKVANALDFSRGVFGLKPDKPYLDQLLKDLSLYEKRESEIRTLSGGMKRRVLIAKALAHQPKILFLDEPTAGVDVELRRDMWKIVRQLREQGVTIILTTHYIEEAEEIADRVGVINQGKLILVEEKQALMQKMGKKQLLIELKQPLSVLPAVLADMDMSLEQQGSALLYTYDAQHCDGSNIVDVLQRVQAAGLLIKDLQSRQSSLEDIFVNLVSDKPHAAIGE